jgi:hypothetical protein
MAQVNSAQLGRRAGAHKGMVPVNLHCPTATETISQTMFIADQKYRLYSVELAWDAPSTSGTFQLQRCQGTEAVGSGDDLLASTVDLSTADDTVNTGTLTTTETYLTIEDGNRLMAEFAGTVTNQVGLVVVVWLIPDGDKRYWISEG